MEDKKSINPIAATGGYIEEVATVKRYARPAHYALKIDSFSQLVDFLSKSRSKKYESRDFEVAGYNWKLALYPNGDSIRNGSNHLSLYLVLSEENKIPLGTEVNACFKLFIYDQIEDQYLMMQDVNKKPMRFHSMKTECGFPRFLPLATFNDASSGYLVNDCCVFGVEISVSNYTGKGESVSFKKPHKVTSTAKTKPMRIMGSYLFPCISSAKTVKELRPIYPVSVNYGFVEEVAKVKRDAPPAHYIFKIESFSELPEFLSKKGLKKYESREFQVSGYKMYYHGYRKLSLYPNGDFKRNGSNHISLYLVLSETNHLPHGTEVNAFYKLFVYNQIQDQYLVMQDSSEKPTRFYAPKTECGFPIFLPLSTLKDASIGYLMNDSCIFGVEIFVTNCTGKGESVRFPQETTITFTMENFSKLNRYGHNSSPVNIAGHNWFIKVFPSGEPPVKDKYLSVFLGAAFKPSLKEKVWVYYKLRVKNQRGGQHLEFSGKFCLSAPSWDWGHQKFILLSDLKDEANGYMVDDTVIVEAEIIQVVSAK